MAMSPRLLRPRATGFNPKSISGLVAWYDLADASSMGPTSSGTGIVSQNGPVKFLSDKSGNGNHLIQSGADSVSPSFVPFSLNGKSALSFDSGDRLFRAGFTAMMGPPYSLFIACRAIDSTGSPRVCGVLATHSIGPFANGNTSWGFYASSAGQILSFGGSVTSPTILCITVTSALLASLYANGTLSTSATLFPFTPTGFSLNDQAINSGSGGNHVIYECMSWNSVLSAQNRKAVVSYLSKKWSIAVQ